MPTPHHQTHMYFTRISLIFFFLTLVVSGSAATHSSFAKLPLSFERQIDGQSERFIARGPRYMISVDGSAATVCVESASAPCKPITISFAGGRPGVARPGTELPGKINHIYGNDPTKWRLGLSTYDRVTYAGVYPGVDVVYYGNQQNLEFDLVLQPGVNPDEVRLNVGGAEDLRIDAKGDLVIATRGGPLHMALPAVYQQLESSRKAVSGHFRLRKDKQISFELGEYDRSKPLVIDPSIAYATLFGGLFNTDIRAVAADSDGNVYLAGSTLSSDFPTLNPAQPSLHGLGEGFVAKLNSTGTTLLYATFLGGVSTDSMSRIAVDSSGAAWVAGSSSSIDFPLLNSIQGAYGFDLNLRSVIVKLSPSGALAFSSFLRSDGNSQIDALALDATGNVYVTGAAEAGLPTTPGAYRPAPAAQSFAAEGFAAKLSTTGALTYCTYLGPFPLSPKAISADANGNALIAGSNLSTNLPSPPVIGLRLGSGFVSFVTRLNSAGSALDYYAAFAEDTSTPTGLIFAVSAASNGNVYFATTVLSPPYVLGSSNPIASVYVATLDSTGSTLLASRKQAFDSKVASTVSALTLDATGNLFFGGRTNSSTIPIASAAQSTTSAQLISLFQTSNAGSTWTPADQTVPSVVKSLLLTPSNANTRIAGAANGIYRSTDAGATWSSVFNGGPSDIQRSPANPNTLYAAVGVSIYRSLDAGLTWTFRNVLSVFYPAKLALDPSNESVAYWYGGNVGVRKSTDGGGNWTPIGAASLPAGLVVDKLITTSDGSLYACYGANGVYKSVDGGANWTNTLAGTACTGMAAAPGNAAVVYVSSGTQMFRTANAGTLWTPISPVYGRVLAVSPTDPATVYLSSADSSVKVSTDSGATFSPLTTGIDTAQPTSLVIDPADTSRMFLVGQTTFVAFLSKVTGAGTSIAYATYLGGSLGSDSLAAPGVSSIALSADGEAIVAGGVQADGFPVTPSAYQSVPPSADPIGFGFVARISETTPACTVTVTPGDIVTGALDGRAVFAVVAPSGCAWTVSSDQTWARVSPASGSGTGNITVLLDGAPNLSATRTATITVNAVMRKVIQSGGACPNFYSTSFLQVPVSGGPFSINVTADAACDWQFVNFSPNSVAVTAGGSGTGNGSVSLTATANPGPSRALQFAVNG
ncbi:MAG: SBBP repeat-containing protein, partial [Bryobacteraceae bacterium]